MNAAAALQYAVQAFQVLPGLISAGVNITHLVTSTRDKLADMQQHDRAPTQQEWDELNRNIATLRNQLHSGAAPDPDIGNGI